MDDILKAWDRYCKGEREAMGEIYGSAHRKLTLYSLGVTKDEDMAKNIASEALIKLLEYHPPDEIENPMAWLFRVAKHAAYSWFTKRKRRDGLNQVITSNTQRFAENDGETSLDRRRMEDRVKQTLNEEENRIWDLHVDGYNNLEIAEIVGMPEKTVANKKSVARTKLREVFKNEHG
jgi:RNA polymerase sigma factor (sigma-70 family)